MQSMRKLLIVAFALLSGACSLLSTPLPTASSLQADIAGAEVSLTAVDTLFYDYETSAAADATVVAKGKALELQAYNALETAKSVGDSASLTLALTAISDFRTLVGAN